MATTSHTIYSRYDPAEEGALGMESPEHGPESLWQTEAQSILPPNRLHIAPRFVPASVADTESNACTSSSSRSETNESPAAWYANIRKQNSGSLGGTQGHTATISPAPTRPSLPHSTPGNDLDNEIWFIRKSLPQPTPPPPANSSTTSLADILSRDPPPLPSEDKFKPRVWLSIGPSNKGFSMLSQKGWNEGEGLGTTVLRRNVDLPIGDSGPSPSRAGQRGDHRDPIDLTLPPSDSEEEHDFVHDDNQDTPSTMAISESGSESSSSGRKALITPLPIRLKNDRLGIGLKAKTIGPYKATQCRVTPSAQALRDHARATEQMRLRKKAFGRGKQGFERRHKLDMTKRKNLLAYLNS